MTVIIADDDPLVRRIIRMTLHEARITVVAEAATCRETVELARFYRPDVLLVDLAMPDGSALDVIRQLNGDSDGPPVCAVVLTSSDDDDAALEALLAGASGWLSKDLSMARLPRALAAAAAGEVTISRRFARRVADLVRDSRDVGIGTRPIRSSLTEREWEVLDLTCAGRNDDEIAAAMSIAVETVASHTRSIIRKLGVPNRDEAVAAAAQLRARR